MRLISTLGALTLVIPALCVPTRIPITKRAGPVKPNSYIVTFKDTASKTKFLNAGPNFAEEGSRLVYDYTIINAASFILSSPPDIKLVQDAAGVELIEPDSIMSVNYEIGLEGFEPVARMEPPSAEGPHKRGNGGAGVDVYGIDTGIYTAHNCFGGRARWGATFGGYANQDGNGHGTHTAGTAVGITYGVATFANIIAVKVLSDAGSGSNSDVIAGIQWAANQTLASGRPSVATMSLGGLASPPTDSAVSKAIEMGLHFAIAAGNDNVNAEFTSPARVTTANTVGAVNSNNEKASFSNYGSVLDVWALGVDVLSAWIDGPNSTRVLSGTSMATPRVAGIMTAALGDYGQMKPGQLSQALKDHAEPSVKLSVLATLAKTTNLLARPW